MTGLRSALSPATTRLPTIRNSQTFHMTFQCGIRPNFATKPSTSRPHPFHVRRCVPCETKQHTKHTRSLVFFLVHGPSSRRRAVTRGEAQGLHLDAGDVRLKVLEPPSRGSTVGAPVWGRRSRGDWRVATCGRPGV